MEAHDAGIRARLRLQRDGFALEVDLALPGHGISALFGPSGSGKTTCLRAIAGLERVPGAYVAVGGEVWQDDAAGIFVPVHRRALGYVFQEASLFAHLDVRANLAFGRQRVPPGERRFELEAVAALLGIDHLLERRPDRLSGGERQRCGLARLLLSSAEAFLVDEPISALDPALARHTLATLQQEASARKASFVCSLHQVEMARAHFPRLVGLRAGRIVFDAATGAVSDAMIAALYENEAVEAPSQPPHESPERIAVGACF